MAMKVEFQDKDGYAQANISGKITNINALILFQKLVAFSSETDHDGILLDMRGVEGEIKTSDIHSFSKKAKDIMTQYKLKGRIIEMKKAYLFDEDKYDLDESDEDMDEDGGDFFITTDHQEALDWLGVNN